MISIFMAFEGVYSIIPTAFTDSGDRDAASQRKVADLFINRGRQAKELGAAAVMVSPPRMPKLNSKATTASLDRVLAWVTAQKGMEWISV